MSAITPHPDWTGAFGILAVGADTPGAIVCGACGRAWLEDITPAGRCPWEHLHTEPKPEKVRVVRLSKADIKSIKRLVKATYKAADGDSNDEEIAVLQEARDRLAEIAGL